MSEHDDEVDKALERWDQVCDARIRYQLGKEQELSCIRGRPSCFRRRLRGFGST